MSMWDILKITTPGKNRCCFF